MSSTCGKIVTLQALCPQLRVGCRFLVISTQSPLTSPEGTCSPDVAYSCGQRSRERQSRGASAEGKWRLQNRSQGGICRHNPSQNDEGVTLTLSSSFSSINNTRRAPACLTPESITTTSSWMTAALHPNVKPGKITGPLKGRNVECLCSRRRAASKDRGPPGGAGLSTLRPTVLCGGAP